MIGASPLALCVTFTDDIAPLFTAHCIECHNPIDKKADFDLTTHSGFLAGGESGTVFTPNNPTDSLLLARLHQGDMPPPERGRSRALSHSKVQTIATWLRAGAPWPSEHTLSLFDVTTEHRAGRDWWALQPVQRPAIDPDFQGQAIDSFIQQNLKSHGFDPAPPATRHQLLRRTSYGLLGLPPSREDIDRFEADTSPGAFERVIDRLLSSPHYGERWGRYWLDLVRYADTDGYERDRPKPSVWKYRDWLIKALNDDMPYDRFVLEQLAGDELPDRTESTTIATGMLRVGTWNDEPNDPADYLYERLEDMVHTTSSTFLGLTVKCARCHDHKFDPIRQADYYRVASYFWAGNIGQSNQGGPSPEQLGYADVYGWTDKTRDPAPIRLLINGERHHPGREIAPNFPSFITNLNHQFEPPPADSTTSHRRLQFAHWIADPQNPLTARVIINRIWRHHFGNGIVTTPNNFGFKSDPPSHPELLDWLAAEFVHPTRLSGPAWTLKRMHKMLLLSQTYQQASTHPRYHDYLQRDAANRALWHFPRRRLDAEALRDSMLMATGRLNREMGGPSFFPRMSQEALEGLSRKGQAWQESSSGQRSRRSVYMVNQRSRLLPLMTTFDFTETTSTCAKRNVTTVPTQALALLNNHFTHAQSTALAERIVNETRGEEIDQIKTAWLLTLQRQPRNEEVELASEHLRTQRAHFASKGHSESGLKAIESLCHVLLNANEFIYID